MHGSHQSHSDLTKKRELISKPPTYPEKSGQIDDTKHQEKYVEAGRERFLSQSDSPT